MHGLQVAARYTNAHAIVNMSVRMRPGNQHPAQGVHMFPDMRIALGYPHSDASGWGTHLQAELKLVFHEAV